jgi:cobalt/nickel transport protein
MKSISMLLLMGLILVSNASAHSLYVEFPRDLSTDANAEFWIAYGHGGSADQELATLPVARIVSPSGQPKDLQMQPLQGGLKGDVAFPEPGCYIMDMQMDSTFFDPGWFGSSGSRSLVEKYGRALLPVRSGQGFGWSSGTGLEIVPETDPYGLKSGQEFKARALWNGKAATGSYIAVVVRSLEDVLVIQHAQQTEQEGSSSDGSISFTATRPGLWVLSYEATLDEAGEWTAGEDDPQGHYKKGEQLSFEQIAPTAYLSFWVNK